jgi:hypothetical protein
MAAWRRPKPAWLYVRMWARLLRFGFDAAHDTVWLTQRQMADRFKTSTDNVSLLLKNTDATGERGEGATTEDSLSLRLEGKRCQVFPQ